MRVGVLRITLRVPGARSLKEKRGPLRRLLSDLRSRGQVSAAEVDAHDAHQRAVIGVAAVAPDGVHLSRLLAAVEDRLFHHPDLPVLDIARDSFPGPGGP